MPEGNTERFALVQALRGLAAIWVVLFHLKQSQAIAWMTGSMPNWLAYYIFDYGRAGVAVFFVLSGFVIAYSLEGKDFDGRSLGHFVVRRAVRLDPPYWASIALVISVTVIRDMIKGMPIELPSLISIGSHMIYMQEFLQIKEIQIVYWTLTYEIQFYIFFAISVYVQRRTGHFMPVFLGMLLLAIFGIFVESDCLINGIFIDLWHGFFLGVLAYRAGLLRTQGWALAVLIYFTVCFEKSDAEIFAVPVALTAIFLFVSARSHKIIAMMGGAIWQFLGQISYSLYLVHIPILSLFTGAWQRVVGRGLLQDAGAAVILLLACFVGAALFYFVFERPSQSLAKRIFRSHAHAPHSQST